MLSSRLPSGVHFVFSSRRRHTRLQGDWSSDVCSSDLDADSVGARALLDIDGVSVAARVLGSLPRTDSQLQGAAWLLAIERAPAGLGPGAHVRVLLERAPVKGLLVPAVALLYGENGAYVYRDARRSPGGKHQYEAAAVQLLAAVGDGWLVSGLEASDAIVVQGAGVLWSLQGIGSFSAAEEEHD